MRVSTTPQQFGGTISPKTLEQLRAQGKRDDDIADMMAMSSPGFKTQLQRIRSAYGNNPAGTTAFLNTRFYGDAEYSPSSKKKAGFVPRILDAVWGNLKQDSIDIGQAVEDYSTGKQGIGNTVAQVGGNIASVAASPLVQPFNVAIGDIVQPTMQLPPVQNAIRGVQESQFGQEVLAPAAQAIGEGYQKAYEQYPAVRSLEAIAEGAFDLSQAGATAKFAANQGLTALTKTGQMGEQALQKTAQLPGAARGLAQKTPLVNRIPGLRPDAPAGIPDDLARIAGTTGDDLVKPLSSKAQRFVSIDGDERVARFVDQSNPAEKGLFRSMLKRQERASKDLSATAQAKEVVGQHVLGQAGHLVKAKNEIGKRLGNVVKSIGDDTVDLTNTYTEFVDDLASKGIYIQSDGKLLNMSALPDEDVSYITDVLRWMKPDKNGKVVRSISDTHRFRQKTFAELDLAAIRQKPFSSELEKFIDQGVRERLLRDISSVHPQYAPLAQAYARTITPLRSFLKQIQYKGTVDDITEAGFEGLRTGEIAMRTLGNASARPTQLLDELEQAAMQWGYKSPIRTQRLVKFADELENIFPVQQTRSLKGEVGRALGDIPTSKMGVVRQGLDKVGEVYNKFMGKTEEERLKALYDLLDDSTPGVTDNVGDMTKALDEFVANKQTDDVAKSLFTEPRQIELKGGQKGRPGIDKPAPLPQSKAQESVNGGSVDNDMLLSKLSEKQRELFRAGTPEEQAQALDHLRLKYDLENNDAMLAAMRSSNGGSVGGVDTAMPKGKQIDIPYEIESRQRLISLYRDEFMKQPDFYDLQGLEKKIAQFEDEIKQLRSMESPKALPRDGATTGDISKASKYATDFQDPARFADSIPVHRKIVKDAADTLADLPNMKAIREVDIRGNNFPEYSAKEGVGSSGVEIVMEDGNKAFIGLQVYGDTIDVAQLAIEGKRQGLGSVILNHLKGKADATGKELVVSRVYSPQSQQFFSKFDWLKKNSGGESFSYKPKAKGTTTAIPKDLEPLAKEARKYKSAEEFVTKLKRTKQSDASKELVEALKSIVPDDKGVTQFTNKLTDIWHEATGTPKPAPTTPGKPTPIPGTNLFVEDLPF